MSVYLKINDEKPQALASNKGWGDVCDVVENFHLPLSNFKILVGEGVLADNVERLKQEVELVLQHGLRQDIRETLQGLSEALLSVPNGSIVGVV